MYRSIGTVTACAVLLLSMPALRASEKDVIDCARFSEDIDSTMAACTRVIDDRNEEPFRRAGAYFSRALLWSVKRDFDRAIADYSESIKISPGALAYTNRCFARAIVNRDLELALGDCAEAMLLSPNDDLGATSGRGLVYLRLGRFDDAIVDFDRVLKTLPKSPDPLYARGIAKLHKGDRAGGEADIAAAKLLIPEIEKEYTKRGIARPLR